MPLDIDSLDASFQLLVVERLPEFGDRFYDRLFELHPKLERLFKSPMKTQKRQMVSALAIIVASLRRPTQAAELVKALGKAHEGYGVLPEHYPLVGDNLVAVLSEMAGEGWSPGLERTWRDAYSMVQRLIYKGLRADAGEATTLGLPPGMIAGESGLEPFPELPGCDPLASLSEYLELNRRWRDASAPLEIEDMERWRELRDHLEMLLRTDRPAGITRRTFLRVPTLLDVEATARIDSVQGILTEIGEGGLFVATERPLERGATIRLKIVWGSKAEPLEVEGAVAWARHVPSAAGPCGMGVRFVNLDGKRRAEIIDIVESSLFLVLSRDEGDRI